MQISPKTTKIRQSAPAERAKAAARSTWVSVGVNVMLSATQIAVSALSKSQGLIADGKHCLSDLVVDIVVLFANHASQKYADDDQPYGHHRFETMAQAPPPSATISRRPT